MEDTITISKSEYDSLLTDSLILSYLEQYGVDNWSGYFDAMMAFNEEN